MDGALSSLVYTIGAAGAIAIAIFLVDAFVVAIKKIVKKRPQTDWLLQLACNLFKKYCKNMSKSVKYK